jgi:hypothetical protein
MIQFEQRVSESSRAKRERESYASETASLHHKTCNLGRTVRSIRVLQYYSKPLVVVIFNFQL